MQSSQQQCTDLEQARSALESEADRLNTQLVSVQSQLSESKQQLAEAQQSMARLKAQLQLTDQDKAESEKQLMDARTGIANLRSRLDDIETELRKSKVQSSLQVHSAMSSAGLKEGCQLIAAGIYHCNELPKGTFSGQSMQQLCPGIYYAELMHGLL